MSDPALSAPAPSAPGKGAPGVSGQSAPGQQALVQQLELRDIHTPAAPPAWPPAPGWWLLAVLLLAALALLGRKGWQAVRRARRRRRILAELDGLRGQPCGAALIGEVSALLKRVALSRFPRRDVAALTGTDWLAFLDRTGGSGGFGQGAGRVLADGPYAPAPGCDADALLALARTWLVRNI
jgi:hypothetical protein